MDHSIFTLEEMQWQALCDMLAKIGMVTLFGMILTPVPQFLFCGLTQKEKETRMQSFSFSYLLLSLLNNLLWLAYAQKIGDQNVGIPAMVGSLVAVFLIAVFLTVKSSRNQILAVFILVSISEIFFSSLVPTFLAGATASFLSISTYFSTLGQIPTVIRERDPRYINMPVVTVSIVNAVIWTAYAILKKDIPLFMTNSLAFVFMGINLLFFFWAVNMVQTESIQTLISFFEVAFPDEMKEQLEEGEMTLERDLDGDLENEGRTKAEIQARYNKQAAQQQFMAVDQSNIERPTEETRLTSASHLSMQESSLLNTSRNPYYYTGAIDLEETKSFASVSMSQQSMRRSQDITDHFLMDDDSCIDYILKEDDNVASTTKTTDSVPALSDAPQTLPQPTTATLTPLKKEEQLSLESQRSSEDQSIHFQFDVEQAGGDPVVVNNRE